MKVTMGIEQESFWQSYLDGKQYDFYQLPRYVELCARREGGESAFIHVSDGDNNLFIPFIKRPFRGYYDAISPYGYPGFLVQFQGSGRESFLDRACVVIKQTLIENHYVSLFLRMHPILNRCLMLPRDFGEVVYHGETISIDLKASEEELWRNTVSGHRNPINRSIREGHRVSIDSELNEIDSFISLYQDTMRRVSAHPTYFFDKSYVLELKKTLGGHLFLASVFIGEELAAAALFTEINNLVQYHLSGSREDFRQQQPTKVMIHRVRNWAKERGNQWMHLGGGLGGAHDSLFQFKAGFSKIAQPFYTLRSIIQPDVYRDLVLSQNSALDPANMAGYFPLYRLGAA